MKTKTILMSVATIVAMLMSLLTPGAIGVAEASPIVLTLQPGPVDGKDTHVYSLYTGTNFGNSEFFQAIGLPLGAAFIQFDLSSIPSGSAVVSAKFTAWAEYRDGTIYFRRVTSPWEEMTVTWNNQPPTSTPEVSAPIARTPEVYWGGNWTFDITSLVQFWVNSPSQNFGLSVTANTPGIGWMMASSDNTSYPRPKLEVEYTLPPAPTVTGIAPTSGPAAGGTGVTITGTGFISGATVTIGDALATSVTMVSATSITATTPAGTVGAQNVVVTNPGGQSGTLTGGFTYVAAPTVTSISPSQGTQGQTLNVTITGTNFTGATSVGFDAGITVNSFTVNSATQITSNITIVPNTAPGLRDVSVNALGGTGALTGGFRVNLDNHAPVANTGGPYVADLGVGITLNGSGSSDPDASFGDSIVSYQWDIASGALIISGSIPTLGAAQIDSLGVGTFTLSLTVTDSFGATNTATTTLRIYDNRPFASLIANPNPAAPLQHIYFDASSSTPGRPDRSIISYAWQFGDGNVESGAAVTHAYANFGNYTAILTVTDNNVPPKSASASIVIAVNQGNQPPMAQTGGPYITDLGVGITLNGSDSSDPNAGAGDSIVSYQWNIASGALMLTGSTPVLSAAQIDSLGVGTFNVSLTVTDTFGTTNTDATTLTIRQVIVTHHLTVTGITSPVTANTPSDVTVTAKDASGSTVTNYAGTIHFTSTDAAATLPTDYTFVSGDAGVHTFTGGLIFRTFGSRTVTATDTVTGAITGTSEAVVVQPASMPASPGIPLPQTELIGDSDTILLEKFNGSTLGEVFGGVEYVNSITNLGKALYLPQGSWVRYIPSGLSQLQNAGGIEFFIAPTAYSTPLLTLQWFNTNTPPGSGYVLGLTLQADGRITYSVWNGQGDGNITGTTSIPLNTWSHIAIEWDGNGSKIFVNGRVDASTSTRIWPSNPSYVYLGNWGVGNYPVFLDELRISKVARVRVFGASNLVVSGISTPRDAGTSGTVIVTAKDSAGNVVTGYTGTVHFTSSDGQAVLPTDYTFTTTDAGVHTFTNGVILRTSGTQSIIVTDTVTSNITGSQTGIVVNKALTTTVLTPSPNPSISGQSVTFTATVSGGISPSGTVEFKDGAVTIASKVVLGGITATYSTSTLSVGSHSITTIYNGDNNNSSSTSFPVMQIVNAGLTITTTSLPTGIVGSAYLQTLVASGGNGTYAWSLTTGSLPDGLILSGNTISGIPIAAGTFNFTVRVNDSATNTATQALSITVNKASTTTTLISSANPSISGQSVTLTATVNGGRSPTGTVDFKDGAATIASGVALSGIAATYSTSTLSVGSHSITAIYSGDNNNVGSTSTVLIQVVSAVLTITPTPWYSRGWVGTSYSQTSSASGGQGVYIWSISSGALPPGLSVNSGSGTISGIPTAHGTYNFTLQVADGALHTATRAMYLIINPAGGAFIDLILANPTNYEGQVVKLSGTYRGWESGHGSPPVTRSDWVIQDASGSIYVSGSSQGLMYPMDVGKNITVNGTVRLKNNQPYIEIAR